MPLEGSLDPSHLGRGRSFVDPTVKGIFCDLKLCCEVDRAAQVAGQVNPRGG